MQREGVTKYDSSHRRDTLDPRRHGETACALIAWRELLALAGLVGQSPERYDGFGYGNVSARVPPFSPGRGRRAFLVSGTQTSGRRCIGLESFSLVERYDLTTGRVASRGPVPPSSEALTHAAIYDLGPHIRAVLHVHSPVLWHAAGTLRIPSTDPRAEYGTGAMAAEVQRLYGEGLFAERQLLAMGGHEDGLLAFGRSLEEAGTILLRWLARAYERRCRADGGLCDRRY